MKSFKFKKIGMSVVAAGVVGLATATVALGGGGVVAVGGASTTTTTLQWIRSALLANGNFYLGTPTISTITATNAASITESITVPVIDTTTDVIAPGDVNVSGTTGWTLSAELDAAGWVGVNNHATLASNKAPEVSIAGIEATSSGVVPDGASVSPGSNIPSIVAGTEYIVASSAGSGVSANVKLPVKIAPREQSVIETIDADTYSTTMTYTLASIASA